MDHFVYSMILTANQRFQIAWIIGEHFHARLCHQDRLGMAESA